MSGYAAGVRPGAALLEVRDGALLLSVWGAAHAPFPGPSPALIELAPEGSEPAVQGP